MSVEPMSRSPNDTKTRVLVVDDHQMFAQAVRLLLQGEDNLEIAGTASSGEEAVALVERVCPDVVIMDIDLPGLDGIEATRQIRQRRPQTKVAVITALRDETLITQSVEAGAHGFLWKTRAAEDLIRTIRRVAEGELVMPEQGLLPLLSRIESVRQERSGADTVLATLTAREVEVLEALDEGATTEQIEERFGVTRATVQSHVNAILTKLGVHSRLQAVVLFRNGGRARGANGFDANQPPTASIGP
jgi:DNA-binding NarL/FixJ family response regulator